MLGISPVAQALQYVQLVELGLTAVRRQPAAQRAGLDLTLMLVLLSVQYVDRVNIRMVNHAPVVLLAHSITSNILKTALTNVTRVFML